MAYYNPMILLVFFIGNGLYVAWITAALHRLIEGRVSAVSPVPIPEGMYILEVSLPDRLCTSYGSKLPLIRG